MTIIRLVNGVADAGQTRRVAASVAEVASSVGVPRCAVDARHEATHNELPSESALEAAAAACVAWLRMSYWGAQTATLEVKRAAAGDLIAEHAAMRATAAAACGGSAVDDDADDGDGDASTQPPARKRRRALLGALADTVPPRAPATLASVLLPGNGEAGPLPPPPPSAPAASPAVAAWRDTLSALERGWPGAVATTLCRAADGLVAEGTTAAPSSDWLAALASHAGGVADVARAAAATLPRAAAAAAAARAADSTDAAIIAAGATALATLSGQEGAVARTAALVGGGGGDAPTDSFSSTLEAATSALLQVAARRTASTTTTDAPWALVEGWEACPLGALPRRGCVAGQGARF